jgi:RPA family protein
MRERMTAIRALVSDITKGEFGKDEGPYVISPDGIEMRRVALVGYITDMRSGEGKGGGKYATITLDDNSGNIGIWAWDQDVAALEGIELHKLTLVIGKIKSFESGELYIIPDFIKELDDPNFMTLHMMERHYSTLTLADPERVPRMTQAGLSVHDTTERGTDDSIAPASTQSPAEKLSDSKEPSRKLGKSILKYLRDNQKAEGVRIEEIVAHFLPLGHSKVDVNLEVIDLQDQGLVREISLGSFTLAEE